MLKSIKVISICRFVEKDFHTYQKRFSSLADRGNNLNQFPEVITIDKKKVAYI